MNFLIACTWDENSVDFFFFLDIQSCVMTVMSRKMSECVERRLRKWKNSWVVNAHFHFSIKFHLLLCFLQGLKSFFDRSTLSFRSTSLSVVAGSPSVYHFSSHMGQLMRHSADTIGGTIQGCSYLWPNCPVSSDKLMRISTKVRLQWSFSIIYHWLVSSHVTFLL